MSPADALNSLLGIGVCPAAVTLDTRKPAGLSATAMRHPSTTAMELAEACSSFVSSSAKLEQSYRELQSDVSALRLELAERNAALRASLSENERVRVALHEIVDSMPCGVLVATRCGQLMMVNAEAVRLLELPSDQSLPASLHDLELQHGLDFRFTHLAGNGADVEQEFCWKTAAGERWCHVLVRQLFGHEDDGTSGITILILRDVTSHRRAEKDREAARNASALAQITSMLAHEIRNPLGSLELFAELIETDAGGRTEWIANLRAGIRSLSGTVNNVLTLHDSGSLKLKPLRLADLVSGLVRFAQPLVDQASVALMWQNPEHDVCVLGNDSALRQVLLNLIRNAIRHTPAGGTITMCIEVLSANEVAVACTDTGCGLRADQISRLFQPGFSGTGDSPGLGLAVCERIMTQHNGSISAGNAKGAGARFTLTLPIFGEELSA